MDRLLEELYDKEAQELRRWVYLIVSKYGGIYGKDMDDFMSVADEVIAKICKENRYDPSKGNIKAYVYRAIEYRIKDAISSKNALKRNPHDKDGNIYSVLSLDSPMGEDNSSTIGDFLCSKSDGFDIIEEVEKKNGVVWSENAEKYLNSLNEVQRQILMLRMNGATVEQIMKRLGITKKQFEQELLAIKRNRNISLLNKSRYSCKRKKVEGCTMSSIDVTNADFTIDMDTTDSYRMDKNTMQSLLEDKAEGEINCCYISQRQPFVWDDEEVNKFYSRILNNQPIPELIICEMIENNIKTSYLIDGLQRLSYAEEFKENRIPVREKGALCPIVQYKKFVTDENGNKVFDEQGRPQFTIEEFNIIGKYYKDLPEFLQKRFNNFNVNVTRYFNCTEEMIDYHLVNYNNHKAMTKSQYGIALTSNKTSKRIKDISEEHFFFKNCVTCSIKKRRQGALEESVARTIMTMYFMDDWKKDLFDVLKHVDKNTTDEQFNHLKENLNRLKRVSDKTSRSMFTTTDTHIWLAVFDKFTELGIEDDNKFIHFMKAFKDELHSKVVGTISYDEYKKENRNTKDKNTVLTKINMITKLMCDYIGVVPVTENIKPAKLILDSDWTDFADKFSKNKVLMTMDIEPAVMDKIAVQSYMISNGKTDLSEEAMKEYVGMYCTAETEIDDIQLYMDMLDDYTVNLDAIYHTVHPESIPTLVGVMKYAWDNEINDDAVIVELLKKWMNNLDTDKPYEKVKNCLLMIDDLKNENVEVA